MSQFINTQTLQYKIDRLNALTTLSLYYKMINSHTYTIKFKLEILSYIYIYIYI